MANKYKHIVYFLVLSGFAFGFGQSLQELQKLQAEYKKLQKAKSEGTTPIDGIESISGSTASPRQIEITPYDIIEPIDPLKKMGLQYYGYDFFTKRDTVKFWENLPTPSNYLLGSGDELVISLWGETQLRGTYTISKDGKIYDDKVGLLNLTGKTIEEARTYLNAQYGRVYATLNGNTPTTFMDVSLGQLRTINVNFVGQVKFPGVYPIHPFSTVITGLIQAGGVDITGSLRKIKIKRNGIIVASIDLYQYLNNGDLPSKIQLRDQDIVVIPARKSVVNIDSAVVVPGIYESVPEETVFDLIQYAGGSKQNASKIVGIKILNPKAKNGLLYEAHYVEIEDTKSIPAGNVNKITVRHLFNEINQVEIIGQVKMPGLYNYHKNMTLKDLLKLGGGFEDSTFWKTVYQDQAEIIRRNPKSRYEKVININLNKLYNNDSNEDIKLQNLDRVIIHANLNYFEKENVYISGEVKIPGSYPLIKDNETLNSILKRAGGYTTKALKNGISIFRDKKYFDVKTAQNLVGSDTEDTENVEDDEKNKVRVAWQNESISLMAGDSIIVKETTGTVNISGQVYNPGLIEYKKGRSLKHYINAAGGITQRGNNKSIIVIYANGVVSPNRWYATPKIEDGSTIIVNEKPQEIPFDVTQFATNWTSIISSMITAIVISKQL